MILKSGDRHVYLHLYIYGDLSNMWCQMHTTIPNVQIFSNCYIIVSEYFTTFILKYSL